MGLSQAFLERRRRRESAIQPGNEMTVGRPSQSEEVKPVGQPIEGVGRRPVVRQLGRRRRTWPACIGMLGMIKHAYASGNIQISQGSSQTSTCSGDTNVDGAPRADHRPPWRQAGIDPERCRTAPQIDASQYAGLQENLLDVLGEHGIDVSGPGELRPACPTRTATASPASRQVAPKNDELGRGERFLPGVWRLRLPLPWRELPHGNA